MKYLFLALLLSGLALSALSNDTAELGDPIFVRFVNYELLRGRLEGEPDQDISSEGYLYLVLGHGKASLRFAQSTSPYHAIELPPSIRGGLLSRFKGRMLARVASQSNGNSFEGIGELTAVTVELARRPPPPMGREAAFDVRYATSGPPRVTKVVGTYELLDSDELIERDLDLVEVLSPGRTNSWGRAARSFCQRLLRSLGQD